MKYEYKLENYKASDFPSITSLNKLGDKGWQIVAVIPM